jgi:hypothetical protein
VLPQIRNQGGGTWNHDLWWPSLAKPGSPATDPAKSVNTTLLEAIESAFGSTEGLIAKAGWVLGRTDDELFFIIIIYEVDQVFGGWLP